MRQRGCPPAHQDQPQLMILLGWFVIFGCAALALSILIADFVCA